MKRKLQDREYFAKELGISESEAELALFSLYKVYTKMLLDGQTIRFSGVCTLKMEIVNGKPSIFCRTSKVFKKLQIPKNDDETT